MKTSVISHPAKSALAMLRQDYIAVCQGAPDPKCAAFILQNFEYWTGIKDSQGVQASIHNQIAVKEGLEPTQDESLWIYKSEEQLRADLLDLYSVKKLRANLDWLIKKEYLWWRNNPKYKWDRKKQYQLNIQLVQQAINTWEESQDEVSNRQKRRMESDDSVNGSGKNAAAIAEITTENTIESLSGSDEPEPADDLSQQRVDGQTRPNAAQERVVVDTDAASSLEGYLSNLLGRKKLNKQAQQALDKRMSYVPLDQGGNRDGDEGLPTPNQAWNENPLFQRWVREAITDRYRRECSRDTTFSPERLARIIRASYRWFEDWSARDENTVSENMCSAPATNTSEPMYDNVPLGTWLGILQHGGASANFVPDAAIADLIARGLYQPPSEEEMD